MGVPLWGGSNMGVPPGEAVIWSTPWGGSNMEYPPGEAVIWSIPLGRQ